MRSYLASEKFCVACSLVSILLTCGPTWAQTTHRVELDGLLFIPADITIAPGDTVQWVWVSGFHNVESGSVVGGTGVHDGNFRSGDPVIGAGTTYEVVFDQAFLDSAPMPGNLYPYYCVVHAGLNMIGSVTVILPGDADADADVDLLDHRILIDCATGPAAGESLGICTLEEFERTDIDQDGDVDLRDAAAMHLLFTG